MRRIFAILILVIVVLPAAASRTEFLSFETELSLPSLPLIEWGAVVLRPCDPSLVPNDRSYAAVIRPGGRVKLTVEQNVVEACWFAEITVAKPVHRRWYERWTVTRTPEGQARSISRARTPRSLDYQTPRPDVRDASQVQRSSRPSRPLYRGSSSPPRPDSRWSTRSLRRAELRRRIADPDNLTPPLSALDTVITLTKQGQTYLLRRPDNQILAAGSNAAALFELALDTLRPTGGTIRFAPGRRYVWKDTVPDFPPALDNWIRVSGYGALVQLTPSAPRFLDADPDDALRPHTAWRYLILEGLQIDGNHTGGRQHVLYGTFFPGSPPLHMRHEWIVIRDIVVTNLPSGSDVDEVYRVGIDINTKHPTNQESTPDWIKHVRIHNYRQHGGGSAIILSGGQPRPSDCNGDGLVAELEHCPNLQIEDLKLTRIWYSQGRLPRSNAKQTAVYVGGTAVVDSLTLADSFLEYSADDLIEINNAHRVRIARVITKDARQPQILIRNLRYNLNERRQKHVIEDSVGIATTPMHPDSNAGNTGVTITGSDVPDYAVGEVLLKNYAYFHSLRNPRHALLSTTTTSGHNFVDAISVDGFHAQYVDLEHSHGYEALASLNVTTPGASLHLQDFHFDLTVDREPDYAQLTLLLPSCEDCSLIVRDLSATLDFRGFGPSALRLLDVAAARDLANRMTGGIEGLTVRSSAGLTSESTTIGVQFYPFSPQDPFYLRDLDLTPFPANHVPVRFSDPGDAKKVQVDTP